MFSIMQLNWHFQIPYPLYNIRPCQKTEWRIQWALPQLSIVCCILHLKEAVPGHPCSDLFIFYIGILLFIEPNSKVLISKRISKHHLQSWCFVVLFLFLLTSTWPRTLISSMPFLNTNLSCPQLESKEYYRLPKHVTWKPWYQNNWQFMKT